MMAIPIFGHLPALHAVLEIPKMQLEMFVSVDYRSGMKSTNFIRNFSPVQSTPSSREFQWRCFVDINLLYFPM